MFFFDLAPATGPKVYVAYVVPQAGSDPVITEVVNTLGSTPAWIKITETEFNVVLNGVFLMGKTMAYITYITGSSGNNFAFNSDDQTVIFESSVPFMAKIEVYP